MTDLKIVVTDKPPEDWAGLEVKTVFALGTGPMNYLSESKRVPKNRTITSLRGQVIDLNGAKMMLSYSPGVADNDYSHYIDLLTDFSAVLRVHRTGANVPKYGKYRYVDDFKELIARVEQKFLETGKPVDTALDLETVGLDEFAEPTIDHPGAHIVTIQFTVDKGTADVVRFRSRKHEEQMLSDMEFSGEVAWLLSTPKISMRGANLKFDLRWLAQRGKFECTNFKFDTTLVGSLLDENRSNGLDIHAKIYVPELAGYSDEFDKSVDKSRMDLVPPTILLPYAGGDTDATLQVADAERLELLKDPRLTSFYVNILHPAARAFEQVERGGILIDREAFRELEADLNTEIRSLVLKARQILGGRIVAKHLDEDKLGGLNITKASLLNDFMFSPMGLNLKPKVFTEKTKAPSTSMDHLMMFKEVPEAKEFVSLLSDYASATKTLSTYVVGFLSHLRSDGRFHPSFWFFAGNKDEGEGGTNTGRLSCKGPAWQTVPKHTKWAKRIRKCYPAPEGYVVVERDYSQGELRVVACIANETNMIKAYEMGQDLHALTSGRFSGYDYEEMMALKKADKDKYDSIRQLGKAGNFGLLYGMGVDGFHTYAVENYGVKDLTIEAAAAFREGFFETYPGLVTYHETYKELARQHSMVYSPLGRIRHLPLINSSNRVERAKAERQSINSPVQSTLSDMLVWTMALEAKAGLYEVAPAFGAVHDATYNYVLEDQVDKVIPQQLEIMENLPFDLVGWKPQLPFLADAKVGKNMAELKEWHGK